MSFKYSYELLFRLFLATPHLSQLHITIQHFTYKCSVFRYLPLFNEKPFVHFSQSPCYFNRILWKKIKKSKFQVLESRGMYVQPCIVVHRNYLRRNLKPLRSEYSLLQPEEIKLRFVRNFDIFLTSYIMSCSRGPKSCCSFIRKSSKFF